MTLLAEGNWLAVTRTDPRAFAMYRRHYSAEKNARASGRSNTNVAGPGETMVLLTEACDALFVWMHNTVARFDGQLGVNCAVFRNEGSVLSSDLVREADELAWRRWADYPRHFTYVDPSKIRRKRDPGRCFLKAGWRACGLSAEGKVLMEITA
ncbi:MAG TPA: hypothetical protein VGK33_01320 [Chloroflexota bacterium]|jgi:hypothetical protein